MADKDWRIQDIPPTELLEIMTEAQYKFIAQEIISQVKSAMHKADVEYLDGQCEHSRIEMGEIRSRGVYDIPPINIIPVRRKDCPICYPAWRGK